MTSFFVTLFVVVNLYSVRAELVAKVCQGSVSGIVLKSRDGRDINSFLGIPYAEPPLGDLRFRSPVPKAPWNGTLETHKEGQVCTQVSDTGLEGGEDCLVLNVYSPKLNGDKPLPVMVFIHGGAFVFGSSNRNLLGPDYLLDKDIVLVTMNYRLGILGFLSTGDKAAPGNFGLKDQQLALKWVKQNINAFGGDSNRITLFGNSAGSASVQFHTLSKKSSEYFNQYIMESGNALNIWAFRTESSYYDKAKEVAEIYNCPIDDSNSMVECLRRISASKLVNTDVFTLVQHFIFREWGPTIEPPSDTAFITEAPLNLMRRNKIKNSSQMLGNCRNEGLYAAQHLYGNDTLYNIFVEAPTAIIAEVLGYSELPLKSSNLTALAERVKNYYLGNIKQMSKERILKGYINFLTDFGFLYPQLLYTHFLRNSTHPVYEYLFNYRGKLSFSLDGTKTDVNSGICHGDELIYLFPLTSMDLGSPYNYERTPTDIDMSRLMVDLWTSYAITSVPTSSRLNKTTTWLPYYQDRTYLEIGQFSCPRVTTQTEFFKKRMNFVNEIYHSTA